MASSISEAQAELISSLSLDDIPIKLRCAICSKLAVNAFRLPCCEQAICQTCQSSLPQFCPVCEHSPLAADDCSPNKSLRTTIRVFLRTAEKKREATRQKEFKDSTPFTPIEAPKPSHAATESVADDSAARQAANGPAQADEAAVVAEARSRNDAAQAVTQDDDKIPTTQPDGGNLSGPAGEKDDDTGHTEHGEHGGPPGSIAEEGASQQVADGTQGPEQAISDEDEGLGDEKNEQNNMAMNGGYANMMFPGSGDFGQMQLMITMQNGMGNSLFGGFPIMGMGMDPMTMQNMYMNGGFQGMGMNGMNNMNDLSGYGVGFGQDSDNNWNGSQAWNIDQNNYNQSGLGMVAGDFGNLNTGFQTRYKQGSYGHFNDYRRNNFGRGRGRGRGYHGGFGRGGYHQHGGNQDQGLYSQHGYTQVQGQVEAGARGEAGAGDGKQTDELGFPGRVGDEGDRGQGQGQRPGDGGDAEGTQQDEAGQLACREAAGGHEASGNESRAAGGASKEPGAIRSVLSAPDVPINAPTGPRAMRQGLPNTSLHHLWARGYQVDAVPSAASPAGAPGQQAAAADDGGFRGRSRSPGGDGPVRERSRGRQSADHGAQDQPGRAPLRPGSRRDNRSPSPARSRSRSRSRGRRGSHRHRRPRSPSGDDNGDGEQDDGHHRKRHRGGRKHHDEDEYEHYRPREDKRSAEKSRSVSPGESRKSGYRGHKDREPDGRRERERHWDDDGQRSGQRSHRDRDRDRDRVRDRNHGWDRGRERDREREQEHSRRRNRGRRQRKERQRGRERDGSGSRADDPSAADKGGFDPPRGPRGSDARGSGPGASRGGGGTAKDPHTLEREARNRERLVKEAQRMAGLAGAKRGRDDGDDGGRAKGRRSGRRSEARDCEEREGGRWA